MMAFIKKRFFFIRHGQTDHNVPTFTRQHRFDACQTICDSVPLNEIGHAQARLAQPLVKKLPVGVICYSPLVRAVQTKDIVASSCPHPHVPVDDLRECSFAVWEQMIRIREPAQLNFAPKPVREFIDRVVIGVNAVLNRDEPALIVAHGGVYRAITLMMQAKGQHYIDNCQLVSFSVKDEQWHIEPIDKICE